MFQWDLLLVPITAATCVNKIDPETLQFTDEEFALFNTPLFPFSVVTFLGTLGPIRRAYPDEEGLVRPRFTHSLDKTQRESHPV